MAMRMDLTGQRYGRLLVLSEAEPHITPSGKKVYYWNCVCDCGNTKSVLSSHLTRGLIQSCGCKRSEVASKRMKTDGISKTRIYKIWKGMKYRCYSDQCSARQNYGGRGIVIDSRWVDDPKAFYEWALNNGYEDGLTIDRIDVNGNYSPENCRWVDYKAQANNTRKNVHITFNGETKTMKQWAETVGIPYQTLVRRLKVYAWDTEKALTTPVKKT